MKKNNESTTSGHTHHWIWETTPVYDGNEDLEPVDCIEGMKCACGESLNVDQVQDIVNSRPTPLTEADNYVPQPVALEMIEMLEAAGYGKEGQPNTLWAMVKAACAEIQQLRAIAPLTEAERAVVDSAKAFAKVLYRTEDCRICGVPAGYGHVRGCVYKAFIKAVVILLTKEEDAVLLALKGEGNETERAGS
jgi:hypothetical protein